MATHSSILAWRKPWTEEPGRRPSTELGMTEATEQAGPGSSLKPSLTVVWSLQERNVGSCTEMLPQEPTPSSRAYTLFSIAGDILNGHQCSKLALFCFLSYLISSVVLLQGIFGDLLHFSQLQ